MKSAIFSGIIPLYKNFVNRSEKVMKIAIIGYGGMGGYHAECLRGYASCGPAYPMEIAGIYDIDPARRELARNNGLHVYSSAEELFADASVGAVLIATPNDVHAPYAYAAAKAGKHIICEKPVAMSSAEAEAMYVAAEEAGVLFEVHQNRRWDDDFLTVCRIVSEETVGGVYKVESRVMGGNGIPGGWRKKIAHGGGMLLDWGVHLIDQMLQMIRSDVVSLYCTFSDIYREEVDDGCDLLVRFENGVEYRVVVATDCFRNLPRWQVYGTEGTATVADWDLSGGVTRMLTREGAKQGIKAGNGFTRTMAPREGDSVEELPLPVVHAEPFAFYKNFAAACAGAEEPVVKKDEVLRVFRLMEAAHRSATENIVIKEKL